MIKKILFVVLVLVLLTGCGPKTQTPGETAENLVAEALQLMGVPKTLKPGETAEISKTQDFYFAVLATNDPPYSKDQLRALYYSSDKYQVLPDEVKAALLADTVWITPAGVKVENPSVTLESGSITWRRLSGNEETTTTVDGYKLVIHATIVTSSNAESGEVTLKMPQFKTLELVGLYVVGVDDSVISGILATGDAQLMPDSDTYVVATVK